MMVLRAYYPMAVSDPELWAVSVAVCEKELNGTFPDETILRAFNMAWREYPDFYPTVGQLEILCREGRRPRSKEEARAEEEERMDRARQADNIELHKKIAKEKKEREAVIEWRKENPEEWAKELAVIQGNMKKAIS